jgi:multiple sugar transport system substrate-binding protein
MKKTQWLAVAVATASLIALSGCTGTSSGGDKTIKVAFEDFGGPQYATYFGKVAKEFEAANPGDKVVLEPIKAAENDYYTKLGLMNQSASTAPDVLYEDTFLIKSDAAAGYLAPLNSYLSKWSDWSQFYSNAKAAGEGDNGKTYGVSMGTDTRALWYNKSIFKQAGIPTPWKPKNWEDILAAAKTIKAKVPNVTPINVFAGTAAGEATSMQGFEMLDYGAKNGGLTDTSNGKWLTNSAAFTDSLTFMKDVYSQNLGFPPQVTSNTNYQSLVGTEYIPQGKLAIDLDGSWLPTNWEKGGGTPWPQWTTTMGYTPMPTQDGQAPGSISMSGGWTLGVGSKSKAPDEAFKFIELALNKANSLDFDINLSQIPVRKDVGTDPKYTGSNPSAAFFSSLVANTHFRPATTDYSKISNQIQVATNGVISGQQSPVAATQAYDQALTGIVGPTKTKKAE